MRIIAFMMVIILIPSFVAAQDGYDASRGLGKPTYKTKAPPPKVEAEQIIEDSDLVIQNAQDVLRQLGGEVAPAPPKPAVKPTPSTSPIGRVNAEPLEFGTPSQARQVVKPLPTIADSATSKLELNFSADQLTLAELQKTDIIEQVFIPLKENNNVRVFIKSHAASPDKEQSESRRVSLQRALAVQEFLEAKGVQRTKLIVMPMGNTVQNADRIHLELSSL